MVEIHIVSAILYSVILFMSGVIIGILCIEIYERISRITEKKLSEISDNELSKVIKKALDARLPAPTLKPQELELAVEDEPELEEEDKAENKKRLGLDALERFY